MFSSGLNLNLEDSVDRRALEVDGVTVVLENAGKDWVPSEVGTAECEEELKSSQVVQFSQDVLLQLTLISGSVGNIGCCLESIL